MASGPITSWEIDGETVETVSDLIFLGSKLTADGDCSHEIKRRLLLGRKVMTNLDSIFFHGSIPLRNKNCSGTLQLCVFAKCENPWARLIGALCYAFHYELFLALPCEQFFPLPVLLSLP